MAAAKMVDWESVEREYRAAYKELGRLIHVHDELQKKYSDIKQKFEADERVALAVRHGDKDLGIPSPFRKDATNYSAPDVESIKREKWPVTSVHESSPVIRVEIATSRASREALIEVAAALTSIPSALSSASPRSPIISLMV